MEQAPLIESRVICVCNNFELGTLISSFFAEPNTYFAMFRFPEVSTKFVESTDPDSDEYISQIIGGEAKTLINNVIAKLKESYIILAGLSENQKSYFDYIKPERKIYIDTVDEVENKLSPFAKGFVTEIRSRNVDLLYALESSRLTNSKIIIDNTAEPLKPRIEAREGLIVLEFEKDISSVIAANYAYSINADIVYVKPFLRDEVRAVQKYISGWKKNKSHQDRKALFTEIDSRIGSIDFSKYKYITFFTEGLPYSLRVNMDIPITYVRRALREDLFIFNGIYKEHQEQLGSAVIFSPLAFPDEETHDVASMLETSSFYVRKLIGDKASIQNLDYYAEYYPYDILHICSHGGETDGYYVIKEFTDRDGVKHKIEYEEVVGFMPTLDPEMLEVQSKTIFQKLDGYRWMSSELKAKNYPNYVYDDMRKSLSDEERNTTIRVPHNSPIPTSCHIKCSNSIHQGVFTSLGSLSAPFIFNNTCSSWYDIATNIIAAGCSGYIGTLWNIKNSNAKKGALNFYKHAIKYSIAESLSRANKANSNTVDNKIYLYWGLHFLRIRKPTSLDQSKVKVNIALKESWDRWIRHSETESGQKKKEKIKGILVFLGYHIHNTEPIRGT